MQKRITGRIQKKAGRPYWYMVIVLPNNQRKTISTKIPATTKNKKEAEAMLQEELDMLNRRAGNKVSMDMTVYDLSLRWLEDIQERVRTNTLERYKLNSLKIQKYFGKNEVKVIELTRSDVKEFIVYLSKMGKYNPKTKTYHPLAHNTVRDIKTTLKMTLDYALDLEIITHNPVADYRLPPSIKTNKIKTKYMDRATAQEFIDFLRKKENEELTDAIVAALSYGLRRSELLGLTWNDVDLDKHVITINTTITKTTTTHIECNTKNAYSARTIPIADEDVRFFEEIKLKQESNRKRFGEEYVNNDYIFKWNDGRPFSPDYVTQRTKKLLVQFGEPDLHFHSLRHTFASLLYEQGVDMLTIQRLMGHAPGSSVTQEIYTHIDRQRMVPHSLGFTQKGENKNG